MRSRKNINVLYIPRWYPSRNDSMLGLFVKNHALAAVTVGYNVTVAYVTRSDEKLIKNILKTSSVNENINEIIVYYRGNSYLSLLFQVLAWIQAIRLAIKQHGKPDLIHAHVLTRTAFIAFIIGKWYKIPYLITEHWSRYYDENLNYKGFIRKILTRFLIRNASACTVVSKRLHKAMHSRGLKFNEIILPNVVDTSIFKPGEIKEEPFTFVNISCFEDRSKNLRLLVEASNELYKTNKGFKLELVGEGIDRKYIEDYAISLNPDLKVVFSGLKTPLEVSMILQKSRCLVLSSNYETFGIVVFEALASGLPVIVTDVADLKDIVTPDYGIVVPVNDTKALARAMHEMMLKHQEYDSEMLRDFVVDNYSKDSVSITLNKIYQRVINS